MRKGSRIRGRMLWGLAVSLLLLLWMLPGMGESFAETVTGYFEDHNYLRPAMVQTTDYVDVIPPYTVVTLQVIDEIWSEYTTPNGKTGYVNYRRMLPVPEYEKEAERYVYGEKRVQIRGLPHYDSPVVYTAEAGELLTVDGSYKGYAHVLAADGTGGYILPGWVRAAEFTSKPISPVTVCVAAETPVADMPLRSAPVTGTLRPEVFYPVESAWGDYYALTLEGRTRYVEKMKTAVCAWSGGERRVFFRLPRIRGQRRADAVENVFAMALVRKDGASLYQTNGETRPLTGDTRVYLYAAYGAWVGVTCGDEGGYMLREDVEILSADVMMARLRALDLSGGSIRRNELLDQAFTLVEAGNPFQARYNLLTGAATESLFPLGVPYFWGGRNYRTITERLPRYTTREAWQSSPVFYQQGTIYLYGYDCVGFVKGVYSLAGKPIEGTLAGKKEKEYCQAGTHVYCDDAHPLPEDWTEAARTMQVGDIMVIHHPGMHAMMYMGTLRDYGYTEEQLPALAKYLDYPLMFQCGENHYSYLRFQSMIEASDDPRIAEASPPDGSVGVCILGVNPEDAEMTLEYHDAVSRCFDVEGACVTMMGFGSVTDYFVYRPEAGASVQAASDTGGEDEMEAAGDGEPQAAGETEEKQETEDVETAGDGESQAAEETEEKQETEAEDAEAVGDGEPQAAGETEEKQEAEAAEAVGDGEPQATGEMTESPEE